MKIITLNTWGGQLKEEMMDFLEKYSDVDVFLFQEVHHNATSMTKRWKQNIDEKAFENIKDILKNHNPFYAPALYGEWGLAAFVNKNLIVEEAGDIVIHGQKDALIGNDGLTIGKNLQYLKIKNTTFINIHGLWNGEGKNDTDDRINQSKKIIDFVKNIQGNIIIGGDFNLRPETESLIMIEKELNLKNLIKDHNITNTRTSYYKKDEKYADYFLISPNIQVLDFKVLPDEVSDHAALYLEI